MEESSTIRKKVELFHKKGDNEILLKSILL